jgi:predicted negative regulator of RcsB-dependent stress response
MPKNALYKNFTVLSISLLKQNFKALVILLVTLLFFLLAFIFYENLKKKNNIETAEQYTKASILIKQNKTAESKLLLETIINKEHQLYSPLALYLIIDKNIESDSLKIISLFDKVLKNNLIDDENLNLIKIKKAIYLINYDNEELIVETLNPIIGSNSLWRNLAINIMSEYFLSKNQKKKAGEYIQLLNNDKKK